MTIDVCCLVLSLLSANVSDLAQTARFTHSEERVSVTRNGKQVSVTTTTAYSEANPLAGPLVDSSDARGEIALAAMAMVSAYRLQRWNTWQSQAVLLAWAVLHVSAVARNQDRHPEVPVLIVLPVLTARW